MDNQAFFFLFYIYLTDKALLTYPPILFPTLKIVHIGQISQNEVGK